MTSLTFTRIVTFEVDVDGVRGEGNVDDEDELEEAAEGETDDERQAREARNAEANRRVGESYVWGANGAPIDNHITIEGIWALPPELEGQYGDG